MDFNIEGFGIILVVIAIVAAMIFAGPFLKKKFPKYKQLTNTWFFWIGIGLICLIWLIVFRFSGAWHNLAEDIKNNGGSIKGVEDYTISKALFLDACPFCAFYMCILLIVDPTRKGAKLLSPLSIMGGMITILSFAFDSDIKFTFHNIFINSGGPNNCYVIMHIIQVLLAVAVLVNTPKYTWKGFLMAIGVTGLFYIYVAILMTATGCESYVSGLSIKDWQLGGEYWRVADILNCSPTVAACVGLPCMFALGCGLVILKDFVFSKWIWTYGNAYSGKFWAWYDYNKTVKLKFI